LGFLERLLMTKRKGWGGDSPLKPKHGLTPDSCQAAPDKTACAPFSEERRMNLAEPTKLNRNPGAWATHPSLPVQGVAGASAIAANTAEGWKVLPVALTVRQIVIVVFGASTGVRWKRISQAKAMGTAKS
jgi:hypothetical protein